MGQLQHASPRRCFWSVVLWLCNRIHSHHQHQGQLRLPGDRHAAGSADPAAARTAHDGLAVLYGLVVQFQDLTRIYSPAIVLYLARQQLKPSQMAATAAAAASSRWLWEQQQKGELPLQ